MKYLKNIVNNLTEILKYLCVIIIIVIMYKFFVSNETTFKLKSNIKQPYYLGIPSMKPYNPPSRLMYNNKCHL